MSALIHYALDRTTDPARPFHVIKEVDPDGTNVLTLCGLRFVPGSMAFLPEPEKPSGVCEKCQPPQGDRQSFDS